MFGKEGSKHVLEMEREVNNWLKERPDNTIVDIRQSSNGGSFADTKFYISIWYEYAS